MPRIKIHIKKKEIKKLLNESLKMDETAQAIVKESIDEAANIVIRNVKLRTPVGVYTSKGLNGKYNVGRVGGTLRDSWQSSGTIKVGGKLFFNRVFNPTNYAEYVEYGHRQTPGRYVSVLGRKLKASFIPGKFMLANTVIEFNKNRTLESIFQKNILEAKWFKK